MRKSYDTLGALVRTAAMEPKSGDIYVFTNKNKNRIKILVWDKDGFWILAKRLEIGQFRFPLIDGEDQYQLEVNTTELKMLLDGYEIKNLKKTKRYSA